MDTKMNEHDDRLAEAAARARPRTTKGSLPRDNRPRRGELRAHIIRELATEPTFALSLHSLKKRVFKERRQYSGYATDLNEALADLVHDGAVFDDNVPTRVRNQSPRVITLSGVLRDRITTRGLPWVVEHYSRRRRPFHD